MKKNPEAGKQRGTKQPFEKMGRRGFLRAGGKVIPALALLGIALTAPLPARADCNGTCSGCQGTCEGCQGTCEGCQGTCEGCQGTCTGCQGSAS
jgi:CXXX repeat radical SAM target protein